MKERKKYFGFQICKKGIFVWRIKAALGSPFLFYLYLYNRVVFPFLNFVVFLLSYFVVFLFLLQNVLSFSRSLNKIGYVSYRTSADFCLTSKLFHVERFCFVFAKMCWIF